MDNTYNARGIILKRWNYKEADRLVRIYTKEFGKITARAISSRKIHSKLAGHLEPFIEADFHIARSKTIDIVCEVKVINQNERLRNDFQIAEAVSFVCKIFDKLTSEKQTDEALYDLISNFFIWTNINNVSTLVTYSAVLKMLKILGYGFELYKCHHCHQKLKELDSGFYYALSHVECGECREEKDSRPVSITVIKILRFIYEQPYETIAKLRLSQQESSELQEFITELLRYRLESEPPILETQNPKIKMITAFGGIPSECGTIQN